MRIRPARIRDTESIIRIAAEENLDEDSVINLIEDGQVYVAVDFSANVLGCSLTLDKIYVSEFAHEDNIAEELEKCYK